MKKPNSRAGFTLAELLIVVAIIAILVAIGIPMFNTAMEKSRETADISNLRAAKAAGAVLHMDGKTVPYTPTGGTEVPATPITAAGYICFYDPVQGILIDPSDDAAMAKLQPAGKGTALAGTQPDSEVLLTDGVNEYTPAKNVSNGYIAVLVRPDWKESPVQVTFVSKTDAGSIQQGANGTKVTPAAFTKGITTTYDKTKDKNNMLAAS